MPCRDKGFGTGPSNTVSFRQGSNVEFEGPSFVNTPPPGPRSAGGGGGGGGPGDDGSFPPTEFNLGSVSSSTGASSMSTAVAADTTSPAAAAGGDAAAAAPTPKREFTNPMYAAMGDMETQAAEMAAKQGVGMEAPTGSASGDAPPPSAVIAPSSVTHKGSPPTVVRHRELAPTAHDSGKDTQCLVEEDDSEC